ncbi:MAG: thermonuclease family protein [Bacilli bacterium]|nr:thermonuclease family protein [Bacilli bacterium]
MSVLGACGPTDDPAPNPNGGSAYAIELGKHEAYLVLNTSERLSYDFIPDIPDNYEVSWTSSNTDIVTVTSSGYMTAIAKGTATVTATMAEGGAKDSCTVTVGDPVDYASQVKLDMNSNTKKAEVTFHLHVDGDTTHFNIPADAGYEPAEETGILKARYLGVDTPESTGKIDPWGKKASKYTKEKVSTAHKIIIESDDDKWNVDSTGGRALVWVWYQENEGDEFKNLNLELLQQGLAKPKNTAGTRYGEIGTKALNQAKAMKLYVHGTEKDPDYYYGKCQLTTLKELRTHLSTYLNTFVAFDCTVAKVMDQTVYVEDYDEETGINFGMQLYLGYTQYVDVKAMTYPNYRIRVSGSLQYYEAGGTYQISDPQWDSYAEEDSPDTFHLYADADHNTDKKARFDLYEANDFQTKKTFTITEYVEEVDTGDFIETTHDKEFKLGDLICSSSAKFQNLTVTSVYTTNSGSSKGAMSLTCKDALNNTVTVRTEVLKENGVVVTQDRYLNKTINVKGIVDYFSGSYQLRVFSTNDIEVLA